MGDDYATLGENDYGKTNVRFLRVVRETPKHEVYEMTGYSLLEGPFDRSYTHADNSAIVPTETQKNTFYALSKKYPIDPMERWASLYGRDMLARHEHVQACTVKLERNPFERVVVDGKEHNHVFKAGSGGVRFTTCRVARNGPVKLTSGFKDLHVMKTTQSGFEGYIQDDYTTLPSTGDRILSTKIFCEWTFKENVRLDTTNFSKIADNVMELVIKTFAGPADKGVYSSSVQQTIYEIGKQALKSIPEIENIRFVLPNIHYYPVNFKDFKTDLVNNGEVFLTFEGAAGLIRATVVRKPNAKL
uniref:Uricase n=1 Tax=Paramoeba aestuarina TaxID=180227 RepID=A0A7S4JP02_9EUKA